MSFIYPQFLWALLALSIPIIVHLFNFRRARKFYFSNVQFLEAVKQTSSSKLRLKHLLVLFSRLLFIIFLVLTFAQPFIPGREHGLNNKEVYLYLDNSLSMSNQVGGELSALDQAYAYLATIVDLYPQDTRFKLLTNDFASFSNNLKGKEEVQELTTEISLSNVSRSLPEVLGRFNVDNSYGPENARDFYLVTDFQKSTTGSVEDFEDSLNNYYMLPVQYPLVGNVYVDSIYLKDPFLTGDRGNQLFAKLVNTGENEVTDLVVKFFLEEFQVATASVDLQPNSSGEVSFDLNLDIEGDKKCRLSFEEFPVAFDNDAYFMLSRSERIKVVEIRSEEAGNAIAKVYGNDQLFDLETYDVSNIEYSSIVNADLLILNELKVMDETLQPVFMQFLSNRGDIMVIPSDEADSISYAELIPAGNLALTGESDQEGLSAINARNPFFTGIFERINERFDMPMARSALDWRSGAGDLLNFKNGKPYLTTFSISGGTIYLVGSPFRDDYTAFHKHALFVPVMYRAAVLSKKTVNRLSYSLDESVISLKLDDLSKNTIYRLRQGSEEIVPNQRVSGDQLLLELPRHTLRSGFYDVTDGDQVKAHVAFNNAKKESELDQYTASEDIKALFANVVNLDVFETEDAKDFSKTMKERYEGINLWKYALVLALIFLLVEVLLLRFL